MSRKLALKMAVIVAEGAITPESVLEYARAFEEYLTEERDEPSPTKSTRLKFDFYNAEGVHTRVYWVDLSAPEAPAKLSSAGQQRQPGGISSCYTNQEVYEAWENGVLSDGLRNAEPADLREAGTW